MADSYEEELRKIRALLIVTSLQARRDVKAIELVKAYAGPLKWDPLAELMIDEQVWQYAVDQKQYEPKRVFCHPDLLIAHPTTTLYFRGLAALSIKAAKKYVGAVEGLEMGRARTRFRPEKAVKMARVYNTFICSIIQNSAGWTLENGYRTVIASMGITLDGVMRNKIGDVAETRVRSLILEWLISTELLIEPVVERAAILAGDFPSRFQLAGGIEMEFSSEPDISFRKEGLLLATVEIKGGTDPAGALERYGAAKKSFEHAIDESSHCRNFFLACAFTDELKRRIRADRLVEKTYDIIELLENPERREEFFGELFHHTLRIV